MEDLIRIRKNFELSQLLAGVLHLLLTEEVVSVSMIEKQEDLTEDAAVAVHRLRRRLLGTGIEVKSQRGLGYWLDDADKKAVRAKLEPLQ